MNTKIPADLKGYVTKRGAGVVIYPDTHREGKLTLHRLMALAKEGWVKHSQTYYGSGDDEHEVEYDEESDTWWVDGEQVRALDVCHSFVTTDQFEATPERKQARLEQLKVLAISVCADVRAVAQEAESEEWSARADLVKAILSCDHEIGDWATSKQVRRMLGLPVELA